MDFEMRLIISGTRTVAPPSVHTDTIEHEVAVLMVELDAQLYLVTHSSVSHHRETVAGVATWSVYLTAQREDEPAADAALPETPFNTFRDGITGADYIIDEFKLESELI